LTLLLSIALVLVTCVEAVAEMEMGGILPPIPLTFNYWAIPEGLPGDPRDNTILPLGSGGRRKESDIWAAKALRTREKRSGRGFGKVTEKREVSSE
jgi:hypothetical protein